MAKEKLPPKKKIEEEGSEEDEDQETPTASTTVAPVFPSKARAPEESLTPLTSPLPPSRTSALQDLPPPVVPLIPPKIITADYGPPPKDDEKKAEVSSLKLFKNVPGKPKESIFETKHANIYALDKDYLTELLETKEKYEKLIKEQEEEKLKLKEKDSKKKEKMEEEKEREKPEYEDDEERVKKPRTYRNCVVRGKCRADSLSESEHYGPKDPMKHSVKRVKKLKKYEVACDKANAEEMRAARRVFEITTPPPEKFDGYDGQRWMTMCPLYAKIKKHGTRTQVTLVNFTNKTMEICMRTTGSSKNWVLLGVPRVVLPHSYHDVEIHYLKKKPSESYMELLFLFYNVLDDMEAMRKEFGPDKIELKKYYAGRLSICQMNENYEAKYYQRRNELDKDVKAARKRAIMHAYESVDYDLAGDADDSYGSKKENRVQKEKAPEKIQSSPAAAATKEKEKEGGKKEKNKKEAADKKKTKKKGDRKQQPSSAQISATQNTSVKISEVTASRDVTEDRNVKKSGKK